MQTLFGTDPDADRLGIAAPDNGEFKLITGNQLGALLADYVEFKKRTRQMPKILHSLKQL